MEIHGLREQEAAIYCKEVLPRLLCLLTPREREIIELRAEGCTLKEIGIRQHLCAERIRMILKDVKRRAERILGMRVSQRRQHRRPQQQKRPDYITHSPPDTNRGTWLVTSYGLVRLEPYSPETRFWWD